MTHSTLQELTEFVHGMSPAPDHLASCAECRDTEGRLRGEFDLLRRADARIVPPARRRRPGSLVPLALAAAALLAVTALVVLRSAPSDLPGSKAPQDRIDVKKTIDVFLDGKDEESALARRALVQLGPAALGPLVDARFNGTPSIRPDALGALILELKEQRAGEAGAAIFRKLKEIRITIDMQNAPLSAVVDYLREITGLNINVDPTVEADDRFLSLKVTNVPLHRALDLMGFITPIEYDVRYGLLFIGAPERLFEIPKAAPPLPAAALFRRQEPVVSGKAAMKKMNEMKIDLAFENAPIPDILAFVRDFSGLNILLEPGLGEVPVSLKIRELQLGSALELIALPRGLDVRLEEGAVLIFKPKK